MLQLQLFQDSSSGSGTQSYPKCCDSPVSLIPPLKTRYPARVFAPEFKVVRISESLVHGQPLETPCQMNSIWRETVERQPWFQSEKEHLAVFLVNTRRKLIGWNLVSIGYLDTVISHQREIFRVACMRAASAIIVGHNHPSGDPTPSEADIKFTRDIIRAGNMMKIDLLDHVIIGQPAPERPQGFVSLRELGYFYN